MKNYAAFLLPITLCSSAFANPENVSLKFSGMHLTSAKIVTIQVQDGPTKNVYAGKLKFEKGSSFVLAYCVEAVRPLDRNSHTYTSSTLNTQAANGLAYAGRIAAEGFDSAVTSEQQAGLQLAIWSAIYDAGTSFTANGANFKVSNANSEILQWANTYYGGKNNPVNPLLQVRHYQSSADGTQNQVSVEAVPEPASMLALSAGVALVARRRKNK